MGDVVSLFKRSAADSINQIKSATRFDDMTAKVKDVESQLNLNVPELQVPDSIKGLKSKVNLDQFKVPNANDYIQPVKEKAASALASMSFPSEIGGFTMPEIPDLNSITDTANSYISDTGLSIKKGLDFNDIKYAITKQDFSSIVDFNLNMPIDTSSINHVADGTITSIDSFDMEEMQKEIDAITAQSDMESIDISQFF